MRGALQKEVWPEGERVERRPDGDAHLRATTAVGARVVLDCDIDHVGAIGQAEASAWDHLIIRPAAFGLISRRIAAVAARRAVRELWRRR